MHKGYYNGWYSDDSTDSGTEYGDVYNTYNGKETKRERMRWRTYDIDMKYNSPLYMAILHGKLEKLKSVDLDAQIKYLDPSLNGTVIHFAVKQGSYKIVEYLLNTNKIDINATDSLGNTALYYAAQEWNLELLKILIERGADVNIPNSKGKTPLFEATEHNRLEHCKILLENGADVNLKSKSGHTVLSYVLYNNRDVEWVAMFMCYGGDMFINTIYIERRFHTLMTFYYSHTRKCTPFEMSLILPNVKAQNIFCDFIINENLRIPFKLLLKAMTSNCELFPNLIDKFDFIVNYGNMLEFIKTMFECTPEYLKLFLENHHNLLTILNHNNFHMKVHILEQLFKYVENKNEANFPLSSRIIEYFYIIFKEPWASLFIDNVNFNLEKFSMSDMFRLLRVIGIEVNQIEEMIFHLLSFGMDLTDRDIDEFYLLFGDGPFFKTLLHMEIIETVSFQPRSYFHTLIYNINVNIDKFLNKSIDNSSLEKLLDLFANKEIKDLCFNANNEELIAKMKNLPNVPSLLQLSRDVARKYIINAFYIKTSGQFYTILKNLPIQDDYKSIISYEMKIY